jgi:hypothetical protein
MLKTSGRTKWLWLLLIIIIILLLFAACKEHEKKLAGKLQKDYQMSEKEAITGAAHMIRYALVEKEGRTLKINRAPDGSSSFSIDYTAIDDNEKVKFLAEKAEGYREALEGKDVEWRQSYFLFWKKHGTDLDNSFRQNMILCQWWQSRFEIRQKYLEFQRRITGDEEIKPEKKWFIDACAAYPLVEPAKELIFKPQYVLDAKEIKEIERLELTREAMREMPNPDYPHRDPVKKTIWRTEKYKLRILAFDLPPFDRKPDYVEVYRLDKDGVQEEHPIISVFHTDDDQDLTLAVVDLKKKDEIGFGIPDVFQTVYVSKGGDLLSDYSELLNQALRGKERIKKNPLQQSCREIYLVQPGDVSPVAEINSNGWTVPFEYKFKKGGIVKNFMPLVKFETPNGNGDALGDSPYTIEHIALRYHVRDSRDDAYGRVVEFYKPGSELAGKRIIETKIRDNNLLEFVFEGGHVVVMTPEKAIGKLFRIDYDFDSKRATIEDKDGDGKLESKTVINKPTDLKLVNHAKH